MTNEQEQHEAAGALEALNSIRETRETTLGKMEHWPWWYDSGYALSCALLVAGQGLGTGIGMVCTAIAVAILVVIVRKWQADTGVWVNGYTPKRARWAAMALAALLIGLMGISIWFGRVQGVAWVPFVTGAIGAVMGLVGMRVWMRLYRKDVKDLK